MKIFFTTAILLSAIISTLIFNFLVFPNSSNPMENMFLASAISAGVGALLGLAVIGFKTIKDKTNKKLIIFSSYLISSVVVNFLIIVLEVYIVIRVFFNLNE